jgi:circadian clock protein KaiB
VVAIICRPPSSARRPCDDESVPDVPVDLVLYVAPNSPASVRARRNLEALLHEYDETSVTVVVRDVATEPGLAESDHVIFTPTLIVRCGHAVARVVGDLADRNAITSVLTLGGLEKK